MRGSNVVEPELTPAGTVAPRTITTAPQSPRRAPAGTAHRPRRRSRGAPQDVGQQLPGVRTAQELTEHPLPTAAGTTGQNPIRQVASFRSK